MGSRTRRAFATVVFALAAAVGPSAQDAPVPSGTFRSRVDVITVDVAVVDKQGRPVEDLRPGDFTVKVDGKSRPVASAQLVKVDRSTPVSTPGAPAQAFVATNAAGGRRIVVAVDQTLIAPGSITRVLRSASQFIDQLAPSDYAALLAIPEPGPRVDFTTDKPRLREAMQRIVGQPQRVRTTTFNLSLVEAQAIDRSERTQVNLNESSFERLWNTVGPTMKRVIERGCRSLTLDELKESQHFDDLKQCLLEITNEAMVDAAETRADTTVLLRRLESFLKELAVIDGPKSLVLVSAGLVAEDAALQDIGQLAAAARTTINVIAVDRERERDSTDLANGQSQMKGQDRALELHGLQTIAEDTGGSLYRAIGAAEGVFDRLSLEMSASYIVAVERREGDPERQRIEVDVKRRGLTLRSPRTVTTRSVAAVARRPMEDVLQDVLGAPLPLAGVPVRLATFTRRDPAGAYTLQLAAQIGQAGAPGGDFAVGYTVVDPQNTVVASQGNRVQLSATGRATDALQYDATLGLQPGVYSVRLGVVDSEGRRGMAMGRLELPAVSRDSVTTSDLMVGPPPGVGAPMRPSVEPHISGRVAAYIELYSPEADQGELRANLEIAEGESTPALTTATLNVRAGAEAGWRVASGGIDTPLPPGRYVARTVVTRDGVEVRVASRTFVLDCGTSVPVPVERARSLPFAPDARMRTAIYVKAFVRGLANVVGEEDFELSGPGRKVTSDFLLVQHPASPGDLLTYRDVTHVDGTELPNREERLADLFLKPTTLARDRVRQITTAAEQYVPAILNPIFVLAFLQADLQPRFELTATDAGRDWPTTIKAVTFVEVARPTILRGGLRGEVDVPVRGTAWIEPETGRVLQTELIVNTGRSNTTVTTRFRLDQRLQIMVPEQMRTQNPNGTATYGNFRRFSVETDEKANTPEP